MEPTHNANTQAQVDLAVNAGIGIAAQKDRDRIASENGLRAELKEREHAFGSHRGGGALRAEVDELQQQVAALTQEKNALSGQLAGTNLALLDWMHSNEVFKRILRKCWTERLGLSIESLRDEIAEAASNLAREDPKFVDTPVARSARERLAAKGNTSTS